jgi:hypothetical protein
VAGRRKRGLVWWLIFVVAFGVTSYLIRGRAGREDPIQGPAGPSGTKNHLHRSANDTANDTAGERGETAVDEGIGEISFLAELNRDRWQSPAGLVYSPVDASQHRLSLLSVKIREPTDLKSQQGFDGDLHQVLVWIDQAYRLSKQSDAVERSSTSPTEEVAIQIELPEVIGWVRRPDSVDVDSTRWIRLVLQDDEVMDASPVLPGSDPLADADKDCGRACSFD